ncbi:MAG: HemK2/MTQ2 family protein methyltransferase [Thermoplasmatota archaeon]
MKYTKVFHFNELEITLHPDVYDPAEDSFLLLESIPIQKGIKFLEIGTGCGLLSLEASRKGAFVVCTDINPFAIQLAKTNIKNNKHLLKGSIEVRQGSLFSVIKKGERFDMIVFNPPYLPTGDTEHVDHWFDAATDGGSDGLMLIKKFIKDIKDFLSRNGQAFFVFSSLSDKKILEQYLLHRAFTYTIVKSQNFGDETLSVYSLKS